MGGVQTIVMGSALGVVGALPMVVLLEQALGKRRTPTVADGLACVMITFVAMSCTILAVRVVSRDDVLLFGATEAFSFLLVWAIEAVRAWRDAQRGASPRERKSGEPTR